MTTLVHLL